MARRDQNKRSELVGCVARIVVNRAKPVCHCVCVARIVLILIVQNW